MYRRNIPWLTFAFLLSSAFVVFFSSTSSPLNPMYGGDSAIFRTIGTAMAQGQELYVDIWDHKGPSLFAIQWLAQIIWPGRIGIALLQVASLTIALWLFSLITRRFLPASLSIASLIAFVAMLSPFYEFGNLTEEWSLPFSMFVLWGLTRNWGTSDGRTARWILVASGASLGILFFLRLNNSSVVIAAFFAYFIVAIIRKLPFIKDLGISLIGFLATCLAIILFFAMRGSLNEMLHATFLYNFRYTSGGNSEPLRAIENGYFLIAVGLGFITVFGGLIDAQLNRRANYLLLSGALLVIGLAATLSSANAYMHYLQLLVPGAALGVATSFQLFTGKLKAVVAVITIAISALLLFGFARAVVEKTAMSGEADFSRQVVEIVDAIPEGDRSELFAWNVKSQFFLVSGLLPNHRFYTLQDWWGQHDPLVYSELDEFFEFSPPPWLVTPSSGIADSPIRAEIEKNYRVSKLTDALALWERVDVP